MSGAVTIYGLCDEAGVLRYVGQTSGPLGLRLRQHVSDGGRSAKNAWLARMASRGLRPAIIALDVVSAMEANAAERRHIARLQQTGAVLTNAATRCAIARAARWGTMRGEGSSGTVDSGLAHERTTGHRWMYRTDLPLCGAAVDSGSIHVWPASGGSALELSMAAFNARFVVDCRFDLERYNRRPSS